MYLNPNYEHVVDRIIIYRILSTPMGVPWGFSLRVRPCQVTVFLGALEFKGSEERGLPWVLGACRFVANFRVVSMLENIVRLAGVEPARGLLPIRF